MCDKRVTEAKEIEMRRITVYLTGRFSPHNQDWHQGNEIGRDKNGITVSVGGGNNGVVFFPWVQVQRVELR